MPNQIVFDKDAFSSGQISSKLWLCDNLEKIVSSTSPIVIWIFGGWIGMSAFLLLSRNNINIKHIRSFDIDPTCENAADSLLENWIWQNWKFKSFTVDCNTIDYNDNQYGQLPDLIINTSTEHFESNTWFHNIPINTVVAVQGNNMPHWDHKSTVNSLDEFYNQFPLNTLYKGQLDFEYPTWSFSRYMVIGRKDG